MTEADWLRCTDITEMLEFLTDKASHRKFRLYACACCRRLWHAVTDERCRRAVEVAERFADGQASKEELTAAKGSALAAQPELAGAPSLNQNACLAAAWAATGSSLVAAWAVSKNSDRKEQPMLLREIFGNPFRPALAQDRLPPAVTSVAQALYEGGKCVAPLQEALVAADRADLAEHFRWPAHPKGCWALDLILAKT